MGILITQFYKIKIQEVQHRLMWCITLLVSFKLALCLSRFFWGHSEVLSLIVPVECHTSQIHFPSNHFASPTRFVCATNGFASDLQWKRFPLFKRCWHRGPYLHVKLEIYFTSRLAFDSSICSFIICYAKTLLSNHWIELYRLAHSNF